MSLIKVKLMRLFYRLIGLCFILFLLAFSLLAVLPTVASTEWGTKQMVNWINRFIPGKIEIRCLDLHWSKGQDIEGFLLEDPAGNAVIKFEKFSTEASLWKLLGRSTHLGFTQILDLNASIETDEKGLTNLHQSLGIDKRSVSKELLPSTIKLSEVNADLYLFTQHTPFSVLIKGLTKQNDVSGSFEINIDLPSLKANNWNELQKDAKKYLSIEGSKEAKVQAEVVDFPVDLIDRLISLSNPKLNGLFHKLLGDRLNLLLQKERSEEGLAFNITALSPNMKGDLKGKISNGLITLRESPAVFHFNITPEFINPQTEGRIKFVNASHLNVLISTFSFPLNFIDSDAKVDPCQIDIKTELSLPETKLKVEQIGEISVMNLNGTFDATACSENIKVNIAGKIDQGQESFSFDFDSLVLKPKNSPHFLAEALQNLQGSIKIIQFPINLIPQLHNESDLIELLGTHVDALLSVQALKGGEWDATLTLNTPRLNLKEAKVRIGKDVLLTSPAQLIWEFIPNNLSSVMKRPEIGLDQSYVLKLLLKEFHLSSTGFHAEKVQFDRLSAHLSGGIDEKNGERISLINSNLQFSLENGILDADHAKADIQLNLDGLPTPLLSRLTSQDDLSPVIGPLLDIHVKAIYDPLKEKSSFFDLQLDSSNFHVKSLFKINEDALILESSEAPFVNLKITPESLDYLRSKIELSNDLKLAEPVTLTGYLSEFKVSLKDTLHLPAAINFALSSSNISWANVQSEPLKLKGEISSRDLLKRIQFSFQTVTSNPIFLDGILSNAFDAKGELRKWQEASLQTKIHGQRLTPALVQSLFLLNQTNKQKIEAFFGDSFDLNIDCNVEDLTGSILVSANGKGGGINVDGKLNKGVFTLNKPLEGSVKLTPLFTKMFITPNVPFLSTAIGSEKPIKFYIDPEQFSCPLHPFKIDQVKIGKGSLDLGKITFKNEGDLSSILSFVHSIKDSIFSIWFTPLYFKLDQGMLSLNRLDMLVANAYTLASWGTLDLKKQQVNLVLGLSAQSLQYAFGVQGLDKDYILQIPLHSVNGKVEIDKKRATGRITSLIAQTQGGLKSKILGNILDAALSNGDGAAPPPMQPFPWKDEFKPASPAPAESKAAASDPSAKTEIKDSLDPDVKKKKKKKKNKDQGPDSLEGAIQLLDQFLR